MNVSPIVIRWTMAAGSKTSSKSSTKSGANTTSVVPAGRLPDKLSLLRDHPLFRELPPATLDRIGAYLRRRSIPKGTVIFRKGDPGIGLIGVLAGAVKISVTSADGRDVVLNIIREGEVFGEIALLDGRARTAVEQRDERLRAHDHRTKGVHSI